MEYVIQKEETCERYLVLNIKEDNVRMSEFIKTHLSKNGRAFYEFTIKF